MISDVKFRPALWMWVSESVILISTVLLISSAFSDTFTWHLQRLWGAASDLCQSLWTDLLLTIGDDEYYLYVYAIVCLMELLNWIGTTILTAALYWGVGLIYIFVDIFGTPLWLKKYKVQPGTNEPVDIKRLIKAIGQAIFNQTFIGLPYAMFAYWVMKKTINLPPVQILPSLSDVLIEIAFLIAMEEVIFYYAHRLLHHRSLYKYIHKQHHEWQSPISITAIYCHPLEHLLSNLLPPGLGVTLTCSHVATCWIWFSLVILRTVTDHSGYHLPGFPSPEAHDYHHSKFVECFGILGIMDYLHGTDRHFRSSPHFQRHTVSLQLKPLRQQFPDVLKQKFCHS